MTTPRPAALVTGGSKGIGGAIARVLARDGFDIWLNFRSDKEQAAQVARDVESAGGECLLLPFDVRDPEAVAQSLEPLLADRVPFVLVNNAGITLDGIMALMDYASWSRVLSVHLDGFFLVTKAVLAKMIRKRQGRIINIASTSGQTGVAGQVNYSAAKAGLIGATRSLAMEVAKRNILVNAVAPGYIDTGMLDGLPMEQILPHIPLGRIGSPEDVAETVAFLCSGGASYITGQVIAVNGGVYM